jgi:hypothetical protein
MMHLKLSLMLTLLAFGLVLSAKNLQADGGESQRSKSALPPTGIQKQPHSDEKKQQAQDAIPSPTIIRESQSQPQNQAATSNSQWTSHWLWKDINWSGLGQVIVAGVGLFIIYKTLLVIQRQTKANYMAARAAKSANRIARDALVVSQRAFLKIGYLHHGLRSNPAHHSGYDILITIKNVGQTPATMTHVCFTFAVVDHGQPLPSVPAYPTDQPSLGGFLHRNDRVMTRRIFAIAANIRDAIESNISDLYVFGYVDYIDQFGKRYRGATAWCYEPGSAGDNLSIVSNREYSYDRPRQQGEGNDWSTPI